MSKRERFWLVKQSCFGILYWILVKLEHYPYGAVTSASGHLPRAKRTSPCPFPVELSLEFKPNTVNGTMQLDIGATALGSDK
jgi:hypothetical protein